MDPVAGYLPHMVSMGMILVYMVWVLVPAVSFLFGFQRAKLGWVALAALLTFGSGVLAWLSATQHLWTEVLALVTLGGSFALVWFENFLLLGFVAVLLYLVGWLLATVMRPPG